MADKPIIYLLHGDDEFSIAEYVSTLEAKVGDQAAISMNVTRLEGSAFNPDGLLEIASAMPFLAERRMVVLTSVAERIKSTAARQKFTDQLEKIPPTTALVLVEKQVLTNEKDRRQGKIHWLEKWALQAGDRVYVKEFSQPKGQMLVKWIQDRTRMAEGQINPDAAGLLASLVDSDQRLAEQEIIKLLTYVNYKRIIETDDVELLTADVGQGNVFAMVDAMGQRDGRKAQQELHRLLEQQDAVYILGMVVRQFRLLLQAREMLNNGAHQRDISRTLNVLYFVSEKLITQARNFSLDDLEKIYRRLLSVDEDIKTGKVPGEVALDTLVAEITG